MKGLRCLLATLVLATPPSFACLNGYEDEIAGLMQRGDPREIAASVARLEADYQARPSVENANDLGVALILAGNYPRAITVLTTLEKQHPGRSRTASNLGTALELAGRDPEALHWIKEGIRRDPDDHRGTEWLHVRVLEAKLALAQDPDWLKTHSVLGIDFGTGATPQPPSRPVKDHLGAVRSLDEARQAIAYQLHERLKFVRPPDPVVGDLYFTWGNLAYVLGRDNPADYYMGALIFRAENTALIEQRSAQYANARPRPDEAGWNWPLGVLLLAVAASLGGLVLFIRQRRMQSTTQ